MNKNNNGQKTKTSGKDGTMRKRFTILELLIVVSVIAILAGMMLPALNKAKQTAGKLSCVNNLKSIGTAQAMYSGDYADWIVPMRASSHPYGVWYCRLTGVKEISGNPDMPGVPPYGVRYFMYSDKRAKLSTFRCPGAKYGIEQYKYTHFTLNAILAGSFGSSYLLAHKSGNVKSPSVTIFAGDAANAGGTSGENIYRFAYRHDGYDLRDDGDPASSAQYRRRRDPRKRICCISTVMCRPWLFRRSSPCRGRMARLPLPTPLCGPDSMRSPGLFYNKQPSGRFLCFVSSFTFSFPRFCWQIFRNTSRRFSRKR